MLRCSICKSVQPDTNMKANRFLFISWKMQFFVQSGRPLTSLWSYQTGRGESSPAFWSWLFPAPRCIAAERGPSPGQTCWLADRCLVWCSGQSEAAPPPSWRVGPSESTGEKRWQIADVAAFSHVMRFKAANLWENDLTLKYEATVCVLMLVVSRGW